MATSEAVTPEKLQETLIDTGSVQIDEYIQVKKAINGRYEIRTISNGIQSKSAVLGYSENIPPLSIFREYLTYTQYISEWDENGYGDVNGWEHSTEQHYHKWETDSGYCIRMYVQPYYRLTSSKFGEIILDTIAGHSKSKIKVQFRLARFLHQTTPKEFDYYYDKYKSMYHNLKEIHGVGSKVAVDLLKNHDCETYADVVGSLPDTQIPGIHQKRAKEEVKNRANTEEQLIDEEVFIEHSTIVITEEI